MLQVLEVTERPWADVAGCRGRNATLFFGPNRFEPKRERLDREEAAKSICASCPAVTSCREHALQTSEIFGVWGGLSEADRRAILAERVAS